MNAHNAHAHTWCFLLDLKWQLLNVVYETLSLESRHNHHICTARADHKSRTTFKQQKDLAVLRTNDYFSNKKRRAAEQWGWHYAWPQACSLQGEAEATLCRTLPCASHNCLMPHWQGCKSHSHYSHHLSPLCMSKPSLCDTMSNRHQLSPRHHFHAVYTDVFPVLHVSIFDISFPSVSWTTYTIGNLE